MDDKKCYVCQKDTIKKYICKDHYFEQVRENERLRGVLKKIKDWSHIEDYVYDLAKSGLKRAK